jgi:hypothetical protein
MSEHHEANLVSFQARSANNIMEKYILAYTRTHRED